MFFTIEIKLVCRSYDVTLDPNVSLYIMNEAIDRQIRPPPQRGGPSPKWAARFFQQQGKADNVAHQAGNS